jgi:hypothetical protein
MSRRCLISSSASRATPTACSKSPRLVPFTEPKTHAHAALPKVGLHQLAARRLFCASLVESKHRLFQVPVPRQAPPEGGYVCVDVGTVRLERSVYRCRSLATVGSRHACNLGFGVC